MEKYSVLGVIGEGSYGKVLKCKHNESGALVALKKFIETEEDPAARRVALREIRMLKRLTHPHIVCLLEVFRRKKRFHLIFEYMQSNLLEKFEAEGPLPPDVARKYFYQIVKGVDYCHANNIIHRDIKPENILISELGVVKLCDFGFARFSTVSNEPFTEYVGTRWYRPPEVLIGDINYGRAVDVWALGCILIEMLTTVPLFPGDSDIDQLYQITKLLGGLTPSQKTLMLKISEDVVTKDSFEDDETIEKITNRSPTDPTTNLQEKYPALAKKTLNLISRCLSIDQEKRINTSELLHHSYFTWDGFLFWFLPELQKKINLESSKKIVTYEQPYHSIDSSAILSSALTRRPSKKNGEWSIDLVKNSPLKNCQLFAKDRRLKIKQLDQLMPTEADKLAEVNFGGHNINETTHISDSNQSKVNREIKVCSPTELKDYDLDNSKINVGYKHNMIPQSLYIKPVRGRLQFDRDCINPALQKPSSEDICLPQIRDFNNRFHKNAKNLDGKNGIHKSAKRTVQDKERPSERNERASDKKIKTLALLKRKKVIAEPASSKLQENYCLPEIQDTNYN